VSRVEMCSRPMRLSLTPKDARDWPQHVSLLTGQRGSAIGLVAKTNHLGALTLLGGSTEGQFLQERPYDGNGHLRPGFTCDLASQDPCVERCVRERSKGPAPMYSISNGHSCGAWAKKTLQECEKKCAGRQGT